jgi:hypothetical protein
MAKKKKKQRQRKPGAPLTPPRFAEGMAVRVKVGTMDGDYPDIPLGGWSGTIVEVILEKRRQPSYRIEWNHYTLEHMPAIYRTRCERDEFEVTTTRLDEEELELDTGEPPVMEQPGELRPSPLNLNFGEHRVRAILGLTTDDPLPTSDTENLRTYRQYLATHLHFPFEVRSVLAGLSSPEVAFAGQVLGLADPAEDNEEEGVMCVTLQDQEKVYRPLADLEATSGGPNKQLLQDYGIWFYNDKDQRRLMAHALEQELGRGALGLLIEKGLVPIPPKAPAPRRVAYKTAPSENRRSFGENVFLAVGIFSVVGLLLGAMFATVPGTLIGAAVGGGLMSCVALVPVFYKAAITDEEDRKFLENWYGYLTGMAILISAGTLAGAGIVMLVVAYLGTLIGGLLGAAVGWLLLKSDKWIGFVILGAVVGAFLATFARDLESAWHGTWMGAACGAGVGLVMGLVLTLVSRSGTSRRVQ